MPVKHPFKHKARVLGLNLLPWIWVAPVSHTFLGIREPSGPSEVSGKNPFLWDSVLECLCWKHPSKKTEVQQSVSTTKNTRLRWQPSVLEAVQATKPDPASSTLLAHLIFINLGGAFALGKKKGRRNAILGNRLQGWKALQAPLL